MDCGLYFWQCFFFCIWSSGSHGQGCCGKIKKNIFLSICLFEIELRKVTPCICAVKFETYCEEFSSKMYVVVTNNLRKKKLVYLGNFLDSFSSFSKSVLIVFTSKNGSKTTSQKWMLRDLSSANPLLGGITEMYSGHCKKEI